MMRLGSLLAALPLLVSSASFAHWEYRFRLGDNQAIVFEGGNRGGAIQGAFCNLTVTNFVSSGVFALGFSVEDVRLFDATQGVTINRNGTLTMDATWNSRTLGFVTKGGSVKIHPLKLQGLVADVAGVCRIDRR